MKSLTNSQFSHLIFLELVSLTPVLIILGNVIPPIYLKLHHLGLGIIFILALIALAYDGYKKWLIYFLIGFTAIQFSFEQWYLKGLIDYFFGPVVLLLMVDLLVNSKLPKKTLEKYERRFYYLLLVPVGVAVLQFFNILPITFWNATYVNYAYFGEVAIPRPNGYLYHGSELSVIVCFLAIFQFFRSEPRAFWGLILIVLVALMTYFKAVIGCVVLLFLFYLFFVNRQSFAPFKFMKMRWIILLSFIGLIAVSSVLYTYFMTVYSYTGYYFPPKMLTGRGAIWNIYLERVKEFGAWNYLFGNGVGTSFDIFADYATPKTWYLLAVDANADTNYDTHNAVLSVFINSGLIGIAFFVYLFRIIFNQVKKWAPTSKWNKTVFFGIFIIPLITIGITIPIYENAIFWVSLGFLMYRWKFYTDEEQVSN